MPKLTNPPLLGCLTLLAASASLEPVYAAAEALPDGDLQSASGPLDNAESTAETGDAISAHTQTINPDSSDHPAFISRVGRSGTTVPNNRVAPVTDANNTPSNKLGKLLTTSIRDASANSNLLAERSVLNSEALDTSRINGIYAKHSPNAINAEIEAVINATTTTSENEVDVQSREQQTVEIAITPVQSENLIESEDNSAVAVSAISPDSAREISVETTLDQEVPDVAQRSENVAVAIESDESLTAVESVELETTNIAELEADTIEIAQIPLEPPLQEPTPEEADGIIDELFPAGEPTEDSNGYSSSPAITISNPSGFGADNRTAFIGVGYQERTRFGNKQDGAAVIGVGLGDARDNVGVQLSYTAASFGGSRDFGDGGFNVKLHKRLADDWSVALGWEGFITTADVVDFEDSVYGSVSHIIRTRESITEPFSRVALTAGVGSGRFRTEDDVFDDRDSIGVFGSMAVRVAEPVSAIVEWTGQDLAVGMSITPFRDVPLVLLPAVRDITGAGDGGRFVLGAGFSFQF